MTHTSDPRFVGLPSSDDDQQTSKNLTSNRELENQLRGSEERYRGLAEQVLDGIFVTDAQGHYLDANQVGCEMLGYTLDELRNLAIPEVLAPDELPRLSEQFERLSSRQIIRNEWRLRRKDGSIFVGELIARQLPDGRLQGILRDITERKHAEEARFRHAAIVESSEDAIISRNLDGVITSWNPGAERIFGYSEAEVIGQPITILIPPELRDAEKRILEKLRAGRHIERYETIRVTKTGKKVDVSLSISPVKDSDGTVVGFAKIAHDITQRKLAEAALRVSEERLRLAQWAAHVGTFDLDLRTGADIWTPETEALYGLPPGGFGGTLTAFEDLIHPDDRQRVSELTHEMMRTGQPAAAEWRVVWPDGSVHWIASRGQVFTDESGKPSRMLGVNIDVTECKLAEDKLREYERAVENAEDMIGVIDRQYRFVLANRQYLKMRNLTREQVVGHFVADVLSKETFETEVKPKLDECFQGKVVRYEMKFSYPSVGERDLLLSYFPIEGVNGVDRVACILHDITDRKRAEVALWEMNRTLEAQSSLLRSQEELLKIFVKNAPAGVAMFDRDMRYLQVSDRWCADYSVDSSEILGRSHYELFPDLPQHWKEMHRRGFEGETLRAEDRWDRENGTQWVRWEIRPWFNIDSVPGGILIFAEDITHRKQTEEALSGMTGKLIEAQEQERARIARELHDDISQRLAVLAIECERLGECHGLPAEVRGYADTLKELAADISSRVYALSHELHSSTLDALGLVKGMRGWCKEFGNRQKLEIDFKSDDVPSVPQQVSVCLFRVLQEALHNAAKHSGVKRIEVQLAKNSCEIHLTVRDSGRGFDIRAASQSRGLGLTSMKERVRLVGGTITIESKPRGGTTIHVRVPIESAYQSQRAAV